MRYVLTDECVCVCHQMSVQECELVQQQGERGLRRYRRQCMQEMHQRLSFGPTFTVVLELLSGEHFLEVVEQEPRALVVVHIYQPGVTGQRSLYRTHCDQRGFHLTVIRVGSTSL